MNDVHVFEVLPEYMNLITKKIQDMKKTVCNFLFLLLMATTLPAQEDVKKGDMSEIRRNNYQVELGFGSIRSIYDNTASATILFKKKYNQGDLLDVTTVSFLRGYFTFNSQANFGGDTIVFGRSPLPGFNPVESFNNIDLTLGLGLEKQFQNRRFVHSVGCDLFTRYSDGIRGDEYGYFNGFANIFALVNTERSIEAGLLPFIGLKYYITDQLSVGIESGLSMSYYNRNVTESIYEREIINGQVFDTVEHADPIVVSGLRFRFLGLRFFTLGYSFK